MRVLVTVGTTAFDDLIAVVCSDEFCSTLISSGYYELVVQSGNSKLPSFLTQAKSNEKNLRIVHFTFKDSLEQYFKEADLVISHAGTAKTPKMCPCPYRIFLHEHRSWISHASRKKPEANHCRHQ